MKEKFLLLLNPPEIPNAEQKDESEEDFVQEFAEELAEEKDYFIADRFVINVVSLLKDKRVYLYTLRQLSEWDAFGELAEKECKSAIELAKDKQEQSQYRLNMG